MAIDIDKFSEIIYSVSRRYRSMLLVGAAGLLVIFGGMITQLSVTEDIASMLPDNDPALRRQYDLFTYAPFARNVVVSLELTRTSDPSEDVEVLTRTADKVIKDMTLPYFSRVVSGISEQEKINLFRWLFESIPNMFTEEDAKKLTGRLTSDGMERAFARNMRILQGPESIVLKEYVLSDPMVLRDVALEKMKYLKLASDAELVDGFLVSPDHRHLLLIADTPVSMTDYNDSKLMLDYLYDRLQHHCPTGVAYRVICGHRYTLANAMTIQQDMRRVLCISLTGLLVIFVMFLRNWRIMYVFMIPLVALVNGIMVTGWVVGSISAITIGFGAVLLGISADYGLHVWYALLRDKNMAATVISRLARPLLFSALTTMGVFAALLFSSLPGQRQLALFSITGIATALILSLFVLPHMPKMNCSTSVRAIRIPTGRRNWVWGCGGFLFICLVMMRGVHFDANLRNISYMPESILADENHIQYTCGTLRQQALVFSVGKTQQEALLQNEIFLKRYQELYPDEILLNVGGILPARITQRENIQRWDSYWQTENRLKYMETMLSKKAVRMGFKPDAFSDFFQWLKKKRTVYEPEDVIKSIGDTLCSPFLIEMNQNEHAVLSILPDDENMVEQLRSRQTGGYEIVSMGRFNHQLNRETIRDFYRFFSRAIVMIVVLLFLLLHNVKKVVLCLLPAVFGIVGMLGILGAFHMELNLFNIVAMILIIGLAADYGIFIVYNRHTDSGGATKNAVLVSSLTTLVGFGSLMTARHPAMFSIGTTVAAGIIPAAVCALTVLPYLCDLVLEHAYEKHN